MAIEEHALCYPTFSLLSFNPYLRHILKHHVEEIIEAAKSTCELAFALHDNPYFGADALVEEGQGEDFDLAAHYQTIIKYKDRLTKKRI